MHQGCRHVAHTRGSDFTVFEVALVPTRRPTFDTALSAMMPWMRWSIAMYESLFVLRSASAALSTFRPAESSPTSGGAGSWRGRLASLALSAVAMRDASAPDFSNTRFVKPSDTGSSSARVMWKGVICVFLASSQMSFAYATGARRDGRTGGGIMRA